MKLIPFYSEGKRLEIQLTQSTQPQIGSLGFHAIKNKTQTIILTDFAIALGVQVSEEGNFNV